jgi:AbrB family looped-hinge helix DNA binding protein
MTTASLSPKYQIVIPKEIRRHHNLKPGQKLQVVDNGKEIVLRPILTGEQLIGFLKGKEPLEFEREEDRTFD